MITRLVTIQIIRFRKRHAQENNKRRVLETRNVNITIQYPFKRLLTREREIEEGIDNSKVLRFLCIKVHLIRFDSQDIIVYHCTSGYFLKKMNLRELCYIDFKYMCYL